MAKYRAAFINKQLHTVQRTDTDTPKGDTFLEGRTGETIWASFDAATDKEAQEKAERL